MDVDNGLNFTGNIIKIPLRSGCEVSDLL